MEGERAVVPAEADHTAVRGGVRLDRKKTKYAKIKKTHPFELCYYFPLLSAVRGGVRLGKKTQICQD